MDASAPPDTPWPDDGPAPQALVRQRRAALARRRAANADLQAKLDQALKHRFGRRCERRRPPPQPRDQDKPPRRRDDHGRAARPEPLERRAVVHDLTEAEKRCPGCGRVRGYLGAQSAEQRDLEPAHCFVRRTVPKSYAGRPGDPAAVPGAQRVQTAGPEPVGPRAKGWCGPGLLAPVLTATFADQTPWHRLSGQLGRCGVAVARSTLGDWRAGAAELLDPLYHLMPRRLLLSQVIPGDDTFVQWRVPGAERARKAHRWANRGDADYP
jgi:transposase